MGGKTSRNKGKRGERELAKALQDFLGIDARRGIQYKGTPDSPDVITDIDNLHIECKRVERFNLYKSLDQARDDAGNKIPVIAHRKNRKPWVIVVELERLAELCEAINGR